MALDNPPPHLPDDTASGPAREWLERERQRAEPSTYGFAPAPASKAKGASESKAKGASWQVWAAIILINIFVVRPYVGWWAAGPFGAAVLIFVLIFYPHMARRFRAYRHRRRANQGGALSGGGSDG